jgi:hypothetical protein
MTKVLAALLAVALAPLGAGAKDKKKPMEWKGQYGGPLEPGHEVVTSGAAWKALWKRLGKDAPALDFKTHAAVAVFVGERPTGGFTAALSESAGEDGALVVRYKFKKPGGFVTQAFAQPWIVRAYPKPKGGLRAEAEPE